MRLLLVILLLMLQHPAAAEVFKCLGQRGSVSYQPRPCGAAIKQQQLDIEPDPAKEASARAKLDEVRSEYAIRKAEQQATEKLTAEQNYRAESLEVARNKILAQQELAAAKRLQAKAKTHHRRQQRQSRHRGAKQVARKFW